MQNKRIFTLLAMAVMIFGLLAATSCKSSGMAMTSRGQLFKINIYTPKTLPEGGEGNIDVELSNRGVNNVQDILADVELPPQLIILDQTSDRGINVMHDTLQSAISNPVRRRTFVSTCALRSVL